MRSTTPAVRDVVLVGGGHSHVQVVKRFAMDPEPGIRLTLVANALQSPYSGMLPGCVAGVYQPDEIHINLDRLCHFAGVRFILSEVSGLDLERQAVRFVDRPDLRYDVVSLNCGAEPMPPYPGAVTVKPISRFLPAWQSLREDVQDQEVVTLVGGGAGGVELAFAMRAALPPSVRLRVVGIALMPAHNAWARRLIGRELAKKNIDWVEGRAESVEDGELQLTDGNRLATNHTLWVTDVCAAPWIRAAGLTTDDAGFVTVDASLRSVSHPNVFAAGDVAHLEGQERAKSGVYAVREGPVLADNLRRAALERPLRKYRAQRNHLALLGCADGTAIASRSWWAGYGRHWWKLKQWIDRRFMAKFNELEFMADPGFEIAASLKDELPTESMRCGGCGAKLAADPLQRVLERLPTQASTELELGIGDDAAMVRNSGRGTLLTVDGFRAMISDPYLFGRISAHHSLNDIFAMAADPKAALALVTVPLMAERLMEEDLFQLLRGVVDVLNEHGVVLAGGHSAEGEELSLGLTVTGALGDAEITKGGAQLGDQLILTKPLGTGVILAAAMRGEAHPASVDAALTGMNTSNLRAMQILRDHAVRALTDVTGFGLIGHLGEMMRASGTGATINAARVPALPGAIKLIGEVASSLQAANELALQDFELQRLSFADPSVRILADPQTSGGLLGAVPDDAAVACQQELANAGFNAALIGEVTEASRIQ